MDLDYLIARVHGRRSRLAEAERLDILCRAHSITDLARQVGIDPAIATAPALQRALLDDLMRELDFFREALGGAAAALLAWMRVRFQVENLKVVARAFSNDRDAAETEPHLMAMPDDLAFDPGPLLAAESVEDFVRHVPREEFRAGLERVQASYHSQPRSFFLEGALDLAFFRELVACAGLVRGSEGREVQHLIAQEVDTFHLLLVVRGKFHYGLDPAVLAMFHVAGTRLPKRTFDRMLTAENVPAAASLAVPAVLDRLPEDMGNGSKPTPPETAAQLEGLAWNHSLRVANRVFRHSHTGLAALVAFVAIRRVERANLITLSEGVRTGLTPEAIRARLIPRVNPEAPDA